MREPRPDWSPLGVNFKILDEHPYLFYISSPPRAIDKPIIDNNRYQSKIDIDFRYHSIGIDKEKSCEFDWYRYRFPMGIDKDWFIDWSRLSSIFIGNNFCQFLQVKDWHEVFSMVYWVIQSWIWYFIDVKVQRGSKKKRKVCGQSSGVQSSSLARGVARIFQRGGGGSHCVKHYHYGVFATVFYGLLS